MLNQFYIIESWDEMNDRCRSIYQIARMSAGLTQYEAAEQLNISIRTLGGYESLNPIPHDEIVCLMVDVYDARWLGYEHLRMSKLGMQILPEINIEDKALSVLVLQKECSDVDDVKNSMISIVCDGRIESHEEKQWKRVTKEVFEMAGAALSIVFTK